MKERGLQPGKQAAKAKEKKKAVDAADAFRTAAKQAAGVHVERENAEQAEAAKKRRDLYQALQSFSESDEVRVLAFEQLQELRRASRSRVQ